MSHKNINDDILRQAMQQGNVNHDPVAMDKAIGVSLNVYRQQIEKRKKNLLLKFFRGFLRRLRLIKHAQPNKGDNMKKRWVYAIPAVTAAVVVAGTLVMQPQTTKMPKFTELSVGGNLKEIMNAASLNTALKQGVDAGISDSPTFEKRAIPGGAVLSSDYMRDDIVSMPAYSGNDRFSNAEEQTVKQVAQEPVSTFSLDVDTASYAFIRKQLNMGVLPPVDAVRLEEMINYFSYAYHAPKNKDEPFAATTAVYPCPWNKDAKILHVGLKAFEIPAAERPRANIVFLMDVSGSMAEANRLPMLKNAMSGFVDTLRNDDKVSIVTYASGTNTALEPTSDKEKIKQVLAGLGAGGSTAGSAGLQMAYDLAAKNFDKEGINRVILATDGDFNVGMSNPDEMQKFIEEKREKGIYLTILGVGAGNLNDQLMQRMAQHGNGTAAYLDSLTEARKVLGDQVNSGMVPVANDAKVQIEFNPSVVAEYRLIGYETRNLKREYFNNDKIDAGDVGSGQTVTAIYEIITNDSNAKRVDPLRYAEAEKKPADSAVKAGSKEYAFLKIRYKTPGSTTSKLITQPIGAEQDVADVNALSTDMRFASAVAGFGQILRNSKYIQGFEYADVIKLGESSIGDDQSGLRKEFLTLVHSAKTAAELKAKSTMPQPTELPVMLDRQNEPVR